MTHSDAFLSGGRSLVQVPGVQMELIVDVPAWPALGLAVVTHPQPLLGGSAEHKIPMLLARALADAGSPASHVVLAGLPSGLAGGRHHETPSAPADTLIVHGECDEVVPLSTVLDWARPQSLPVVVVPGADHFFRGRLPLLRALAMARLKSHSR